MKYDRPELTALTPAINAIQGTSINKETPSTEDSDLMHSVHPSYEEWE